jgi:membrane protease YdiL (CAAX protease family)
MSVENTPVHTNEIENEIIVPWSLREIIYALISILFLSIGMIWVAYQWPSLTALAMISYELVFIIPVLVILFIKKAAIKTLGLRRFSLENLALGCGLLFGAYLLIMIHNMLLVSFGVAPQGEYLLELFNGGEGGFGVLVFAAVIIAPFAEEIFFRGFIFGGLRKKYGWKKAAIFSASLFAIIHLQLVMLIPAFLLGFLFAYLYDRSKSIWPGVILHFAVNSFTFAMIYLFSLFESYF